MRSSNYHATRTGYYFIWSVVISFLLAGVDHYFDETWFYWPLMIWTTVFLILFISFMISEIKLYGKASDYEDAKKEAGSSTISKDRH